jgi:hypothetical protein
MAERPQQQVQFQFDAHHGGLAIDNGLYGLVRVGRQVGIVDQAHQRAEAEHVAEQLAGRLRRRQIAER